LKVNLCRWGGVALVLALGLNSALALDTVRVGKAVPGAFAFGVVEVGIDNKIWEKEGLAIEVFSMNGDAQLQQAMAAGSIDVGLGSGPALGFHAKGAPAIGVAALYGAPTNLALIVPANSPLKTPADLKGKRVGVTTKGSLTDWLVRALSQRQGWGPEGIQILALGSVQARLAVMERGELDASVQEAATSYELEEQGKVRTFLLFGDIVKDFYTHVVFATDDMVTKRPALLRRYLHGWFSTIAFMRANKAAAIASEENTINVRPSIASRIYDTQMPSFSRDGAWDPAAIDVIRGSLKELGILDFEPDAKALYSDAFVPVKL
jgi:NitT/TauT family transport system substrate-binding protein